MNEHHDDPEDAEKRSDDDEHCEEGQEQPEAAVLPPKRFRARPDEELDPQHYIVSDDRTAATAILSGGSIGKTRGDAQFIGEAIRRLAGALRETAQLHGGQGGVLAFSNPLLRRLAFEQSVTLEFEIGEVEDVQLGLDGVRHSPTLDAAHTLHELLGAEPDQLVERAVRIGPNAANTYKGFLNTLAKDAVTLEWIVPDTREVVIITSDQARRDAAILTKEGQRGTERLILPGTLTMADAELNQFKLTLPPDVARPSVLKGKHRISGHYPEELEQKLKDKNLWDSEVTATIEVTYDVPGTTPTPRELRYELVDAEPLIHQRLFE